MSAIIVIDDGTNPPSQLSLDRDVTFLGNPFTFSNFDNTGVLAWRWSLRDKPLGSAAALSSTTGATTDLTPDVEGTYIVELKTYLDLGATDLDDADVEGVGIRFALPFDWRIPGATETTQFSPTTGWAKAVEEILRDTRGSVIVNDLQDAYDLGSGITTGALGAVDLIRGAATPDGESLLTLTDANANPGRTVPLLDISDTNVLGVGGMTLRVGAPASAATLPSGSNLGGNDAEVAQFWEDRTGASINTRRLLTFDSNVMGTGWAAGFRNANADNTRVPKGVVIGEVDKQTYLRVIGETGAGVDHYLDIGPYNFGMAIEVSSGILELFIGGGASPLSSDASILSVRHKAGGSVDTQGSRIEARDDNDTGGFTIACEYDDPRLYITNTPGGLSIKDILYTALGGSSAATRGQHRFQRKTTPTAGVSMVGATEAADVYGRGYVATIRVDAIPVSGETGFVLDSVPASSFVAERVSLTEPVSNVTQVSGGSLRSEGRFWDGAVAATHFGDLKFEAISGINEGRRWAMYDDATEYVAWRWGGGADTYWQAIGGGRVFLQDFAGNNAMIFHQSGVIEIDTVQSRSAAAWKIFADGDAVLGAQVMAGTEKLRVVGTSRFEGDILVTGSSLEFDQAAQQYITNLSTGALVFRVSAAEVVRFAASAATFANEIALAAGSYSGPFAISFGATDPDLAMYRAGVNDWGLRADKLTIRSPNNDPATYWLNNAGVSLFSLGVSSATFAAFTSGTTMKGWRFNKTYSPDANPVAEFIQVNGTAIAGQALLAVARSISGGTPNAHRVWEIDGDAQIRHTNRITGTIGPEYHLIHNDGDVSQDADVISKIGAWAADDTTPGTMLEYTRIQSGVAGAGGGGTGQIDWYIRTAGVLGRALQLLGDSTAAEAGVRLLTGRTAGTGPGWRFCATNTFGDGQELLAVESAGGGQRTLILYGDGDLTVTRAVTGTLGPDIQLIHNDGQIGVALDELGRISGWGADNTTAGTMREYARLHPIIVSAAAGSITGGWSFSASLLNTMAKFLDVRPSVSVDSGLAGVALVSWARTVGEGGGGPPAMEITANSDFGAGAAVLRVSDGLGANVLFDVDGDGDVVVTKDIEAAGGYRQTVGQWNTPQPAGFVAAQTDLAMPLDSSTVAEDFVVIRAGSITGISIHTDAGVTAGTLTINVRKNGTIVWTIGVTATVTTSTQAKDTDAFVAGDLIDVSYTTDTEFAGPAQADVTLEYEA